MLSRPDSGARLYNDGGVWEGGARLELSCAHSNICILVYMTHLYV